MDKSMNEHQQTAPFAAFEWMLSARYLRARRKEGSISVIAGFSFLGIMLGVMGTSRGSVMRIFLITGASIGVVGALTGVMVGLVICLNIESIRQFLSWLTNTDLFPPELYFLSKLPAEIDVGETTAVVTMALTLSFLATLYPSWRAARLDPVEALRYG
jgi:lipoprotein-releasing system permease protein